MPLRIAILGSTGSIGQSALSVVDTHADRVQVVALAAGNNVERLAEQVARRRGAEDRHHKERPAFDAPDGKGLPEIFGVMLDPEMISCVPEAKQAESRVDREAGHSVAGARWLGLKHVVGEDDRGAQVAQEIAGAVARKFGRHGLVDRGSGADRIFVDAVVEGKHLPVEPFIWVGDLARCGRGGRASGERE